MNDRNAMIEETLRTLLASNEALQVAVSSIRDNLEKLQKTFDKQQESISHLLVDVTATKVGLSHCATKADVEAVRTAFHKGLEAQTWKLVVLLTALGSGLTAAVYYIARSVH
jgi:hypothetical protein